MNLIILNGHIAKVIEQANNTMFLMKVCMLVRCMASPKHPQSFTGLHITNHKVMRVIIAINGDVIFEISLRLIANSRNIPKQNSSAASAVDVKRVIQSGITDRK